MVAKEGYRWWLSILVPHTGSGWASSSLSQVTGPTRPSHMWRGLLAPLTGFGPPRPSHRWQGLVVPLTGGDGFILPLTGDRASLSLSQVTEPPRPSHRWWRHLRPSHRWWRASSLFSQVVTLLLKMFALLSHSVCKISSSLKYFIIVIVLASCESLPLEWEIHILSYPSDPSLAAASYQGQM